MKKVEQVSGSCNIIIDYDRIMRKSEQKVLLTELFDNIEFKDEAFHIGNVVLLVKNVTYLGIPHPINKKRIQIPLKFLDQYNHYLRMSKKVYFVGLYIYTEDPLFVVFIPKTYALRSLNNSSAHIYTEDLQKAKKRGVYRKFDKNNNEILVFNSSNFVDYINKANQNVELDILVQERKLQEYIADFWMQIPRVLYAVECFDEMMNSEYSKAFEPEWIGFYYEFLFEEYLRKNPNSDISLLSDKRQSGIDLDIQFNSQRNFYGDLKAHVISSNILGNDLRTVKSVIDSQGKIWYIVTEFTSELDKNHQFVATDYWREKKIDYSEKGIKKFSNTRFRSYSSRMKFSVKIEKFMILDIDEETFKHTTIFEQGLNSNGKKRNNKISIQKSQIEKLKIFEKVI